MFFIFKINFTNINKGVNIMEIKIFNGLIDEIIEITEDKNLIKIREEFKNLENDDQTKAYLYLAEKRINEISFQLSEEIKKKNEKIYYHFQKEIIEKDLNKFIKYFNNISHLRVNHEALKLCEDLKEMYEMVKKEFENDEILDFIKNKNARRIVIYYIIQDLLEFIQNIDLKVEINSKIDGLIDGLIKASSDKIIEIIYSMVIEKIIPNKFLRLNTELKNLENKIFYIFEEKIFEGENEAEINEMLEYLSKFQNKEIEAEYNLPNNSGTKMCDFKIDLDIIKEKMKNFEVQKKVLVKFRKLKKGLIFGNEFDKEIYTMINSNLGEFKNFVEKQNTIKLFSFSEYFILKNQVIQKYNVRNFTRDISNNIEIYERGLKDLKTSKDKVELGLFFEKIKEELYNENKKSNRRIKPTQW